MSTVPETAYRPQQSPCPVQPLVEINGNPGIIDFWRLLLRRLMAWCCDNEAKRVPEGKTKAEYAAKDLLNFSNRSRWRGECVEHAFGWLHRLTLRASLVPAHEASFIADAGRGCQALGSVFRWDSRHRGERSRRCDVGLYGQVITLPDLLMSKRCQFKRG